MASEPDQHSSPASFYASPQAARHARPEEFLYLACLHEGTGVDEPDFLAVVDAEDGRVVHETPMPNVGDELHHFGWNRCSSACHGPDRSHLIVPGFRSSRIHVLNVADDPRRPRIEKVIEPRELVEKTGYTRPHTVHCMPGDNVVVSMLGDRDGGGAGGFAVLDARTFEVKGRWENGGALAAVQLRLLVPAAQERARSPPSSASRTPTRRASTSRRRGGALRAAACTSGIWPSAARADARARRDRAAPVRGALAARSRRRRGLRRRCALEHDVALPARQRRLRRRPGDRGRERSSSTAGRFRRLPGVITDLVCRWTTGSCTSPTGCTATCASTTSPTPPTRG